jgi:4-hydroxy-3-methylbut-2-enyl diphosphate reductase
MSKKLYLATPRGFCAGVSRAIEIVERVLKKHKDENVYIFHEVVHNKYVCETLCKQGAKFVESLDDVPNNAIVVFSAHGVSKAIENKALEKNLKIYDATCPIVEKVHRKVNKLSQLGEEVIMIGHLGHQEVEGTLGQYTSSSGGIYVLNGVANISNLKIKNENKLHFVTQTTLSVDETKECIEELQRRYPKVSGPNTNDICYATSNRQQAVKDIVKYVELVLVVGSKNSSNSNRLREVAEGEGAKAYLIDDYTDLDESMLIGVEKIGITSGASAPEYLIEDLVEFLKTKGFVDQEEVGVFKEKQAFKLPKDLVE